MAKSKRRASQQPAGPSQRQLRAGEVVRHALVEILAREQFRDPELENVNITVGEVRSSPDLKHAHVFVSELGASDPSRNDTLAAALDRAKGFIRGHLGRQIDMKFTPDLHFIADHSYDEAQEIEALLRRDEVRRDTGRD